MYVISPPSPRQEEEHKIPENWILSPRQEEHKTPENCTPSDAILVVSNFPSHRQSNNIKRLTPITTTMAADKRDPTTDDSSVPFQIPIELQDSHSHALLINPVYSTDEGKFFNESSYHTAWLMREVDSFGRELPDWYRKCKPLRLKARAWAQMHQIDVESVMQQEMKEVERLKVVCLQEHRLATQLPGYCGGDEKMYATSGNNICAPREIHDESDKRSLV